MKCPLLMQAAMYMSPAEADMMADCLKEECAWWDEAEQQCARLSEVTFLVAITSLLRSINEKMPHAGQFTK